MAKKETKTVSINSIEKIITSGKRVAQQVEFNVDGEIIEVLVASRITFKEACSLVDFIVDTVFQAGFDARLQEFAFNQAILEYFTNLKTLDAQSAGGEANDKNIERLFSLCINGWFINKVKNAIDIDILNYITKAVNDQIEYRKELVISTPLPSRADELWEAVTGLINSIKDKFASSFDEKTMADLAPAMKQIIPVLSSLKKEDVADAVVKFERSKENG